MRRIILGLSLFSGVVTACAEPTEGVRHMPEVARLHEALTFAESAGIVSMEAENFTFNTSQGSHSWALQTAGGAPGGSAMESTPDNGTAYNTGYTTASPRLDFEVTFASAGTYQVWVRGRAGGSASYTSDSVHVGLNGSATSSADRISSFSASFGWSRSTLDGPNATINVPSAGTHTVNVWMREDGFDLDKLALTMDSGFVPSGNGPAETPGGGSSGDCLPGSYEAETMTSTTGGSVSGGWNIWSNGNISTTHAFGAGPATLTVTAYGSQALGVWPNMIVSVGGSQIGQVSVSTTSWTAYEFPFTAAAGSQTVTVAFDNDYYDQGAGQDRNLYVDKVEIECPTTTTCTDDETQPGTTACGLNARGVFEQLCALGEWEDTAICLDPDECTDDQTQPGSTPCGLNGRGSLDDICIAGQWQDSTTCQDPDECTDDDTQPGTTACGLNGRGVVEQLCTSGTWGDTATCLDPDVCVDGSTQTGAACGLNGRGSLEQTCVAGQWEDGACRDPDECVDSSTQPGTTACGSNGRGLLQQLCTAGSWGDTATCLDPDECTDGATQPGTTACGLNGRGALDQLCVFGAWTDTATCQDPDVCTDGATEPGTTPCGLNGRGTVGQVCVTGQWQSGVCNDPDECVDDTGQAGTTACGLNGRGALDQVCVIGSWQDTTECTDPDVCIDDDAQPGTTACGLNGRGALDEVCVLGQWEDTTTCQDPDQCVDGTLQTGSTPCGTNGNLEQECVVGSWQDTSTCIEGVTCGDDICSATESCSTCSEDCGACSYTAVWLEAEDGAMSGSPSFGIIADAGASGGEYITPASNNLNAPGPNRATYTVELVAGTYLLWARVTAPSFDDDSLWVSVDGGSFIKWNNIPASTSWQWDDLHDSDSGESLVQINLSTGTHTIVLANRENGITVDKLYITSEGDVPSGAGGQGGSCNGLGCSDQDGDGVPDSLDQCPNTPPGTPVDAVGCPPADGDGDGVLDSVDLCPNTPPGTTVDQYGCAASDLDGDGVSDFDDQCPGTNPGDPVDIYGCSVADSDGDGVIDSEDECPDTPPGTPVDLVGCPYDDTVPVWNGPPPPDSDFTTTTIATGLNEPMEVEIAANGQVYVVGRGGEFYALEGGSMNHKDTIPTTTFEENGLIGFALDPNFVSNRYAYFHYTHPTLPELIVSRIPINAGNTLDFGAEAVMLTYGVQMNDCCHAAGDMEFGPDGNLYIATGDNTPASNYAPIDERPGQSVGDAQKSSSNTNDLRGKILRIRPTPSGGYTIPPGNLFQGDATHRAEIYVMGNRNPYRIGLDPQTGELFWGEIGPDANSSDTNRGPTGYDELNRASQAGNYGWPYFTGFNEPYRDFDFAISTPGPYFDPENVVNNSPNNTGALNLPDAEPAWVRLSHRATMVGGVYRWDPSISDPGKLPSYFHGRLLYWNFNNDQMFEAPIDSGSPTLRQWLNTTPLAGIIDATFSPQNGHLYLLGYGGNCCNKPAFAGMLVEVNYVGEGGTQEPAEGYAINTAGGSYVASDGTTFAADTLYSGGEVSSVSDAISGTPDPTLYQTHRWQSGGFSYSLPLMNDDYEVTLKFAETYFNQAGERSFHVDAEAQRVVSSLDVHALVGHDTAYDQTFTVTVTDGVLNLDFVPEVENPFISGIVVEKPQSVGFGSNISLQAGINGKYVTADTGGAMASENGVGDSETFTIVDGGAGTIALRSVANDLYLSVGSDPNATLSASASSISLTERFSLIENLGGYHVIRSAFNDGYVTASQAGDGPLTASSPTIGGWQIFAVSPVTICEPSAGYGIDCRPQAAPYLNMPATPNPTLSNVPATLSETGAFADVVTLTPSDSMIPFQPISPLWSDRAEKERWISVPSGAAIGWQETSKWDFPAGTVFVKHFELPIDEDNSLLTKRLETRLLVVRQGGGVYGVTYRWRSDDTEADLLTTALQEDFTISSAAGDWVQTWTYPSPSDCLSCHNSEAKGVLGAKTASLNGSWTYPSGATDNQLRTWNHLGLFNQSLDESQLASYPTHANLADSGSSMEHRLRSYWDMNCGQCHGTLGIASLWDARFETPMSQQGIVNGPLANQRDYLADYGLAAPFVVDPGDPGNSILYIRDVSEDPYDRMPPLARALTDVEYMSLLEQWINSL